MYSYCQPPYKYFKTIKVDLNLSPYSNTNSSQCVEIKIIKLGKTIHRVKEIEKIVLEI